ncbi:TatD family deoxyribonuclease [Patescibacteria group bacterium]|nr:MAG: TatD family deoxyribonuclease [Patescibacteria group bacterium]
MTVVAKPAGTIDSLVTDSSMALGVDTHAHLHFPQFQGQVEEVIQRANDSGIGRIINVGTSSEDSRRAVQFASRYQALSASVGIHPYEAVEAPQAIEYLSDLANERSVVAIGECGLDFAKSEATPAEQEQALRLQLELAQAKKLPVIFHVRDAFDHFWKVVSDYPSIKAVVHSFTGGRAELGRVLQRGWMVGLNGIMTFTKEPEQQAMAKEVPLTSLLLETDCPFLSPHPHRGKRNEPSRVVDIAEFLAELRGESPEDLLKNTGDNARRLFKL